jgi:hypothetical protein
LNRTILRAILTVGALSVGIIFCGVAGAQTVDATVCEVVGHPGNFDGKTVRLTGTVQVGVDSFLMRGESCSDALWLSYPAGTKAKSGPATVVTLQLASDATGTAGPARPAVTLTQNADFANFDKLLSEKVKTPGLCLACVKNNVKATLVGRIDGTANPGLTRDAGGKITSLDGFGNMNQYGARLVIESVSGVTAEPIDFSKAPKVDGDNQGGTDKKYLGLAETAEKAYPAGSPVIGQIQAALDAYGKPGVDNGVTVAFGGTANVPEGEGTKGAKSAPEGLLITARFDPDKLKGLAMSLAAARDGAEANDLLAPTIKSLDVMENDGWQTVLLVTIGSRQKSLTVPGGAVLWSESWPAAERTTQAESALKRYVVDHEQQSH